MTKVVHISGDIFALVASLDFVSIEPIQFEIDRGSYAEMCAMKKGREQ